METPSIRRRLTRRCAVLAFVTILALAGTAWAIVTVTELVLT
jgi:hypothetical protein